MSQKTAREAYAEQVAAVAKQKSDAEKKADAEKKPEASQEQK